MNTGVQRSGATPPAARTANTQAGRRGAGQRLRPGQERAADRDGARDPLRRDGDRRRAARPRGQGRAGDGVPRRPLPARLRPLPARLGLARRATRSGSPGWPRRPASSPSSRPRTAIVTGVSKIRRQVPVEEYLRLQRRFAHLFGDPGRPDVVARIQAGADRNIARFGLLPGRRRHADGQAVRDHARRRLQPRQQDRLLARPSAPSTSTGCRRATTPARPARTSRSGSTRPRRAATTSAPGARSSRTTRSRRSWAGSVTTRARPPATARSSTRRSASTRSSASSATRRSSRAGRSRSTAAADRQARAGRRRRARPGLSAALPPRARSATR